MTDTVNSRDPGEVQLYAIPSIIGVLDKPGLVGWAARETAKEAVRVASSLPQWVERRGAERTEAWLADARFRSPADGSMTSASLGRMVHDEIKQFVLTGQRRSIADVEAAAMVDTFVAWSTAFQPEHVAAGTTVYSLRHGYAGQLDGIMDLGDKRYLIDYQVSRTDRDAKGRPTMPYPETALSLAALRHASHIAVWRARINGMKWDASRYLISAEENAQALPMLKVDGALCLWITPERCEAYPVKTDVAALNVFLRVMEAWIWRTEQAAEGIGAPLVLEEAA